MASPCPARLVLGFCASGAVHIAVRGSFADDETIIETGILARSAPVGAGSSDAAKEALMQCVVCHNGSTLQGTTTVTFDRAGSTIVVRSVPAEICENCGEAYVAEAVTGSLLASVREARTAGTEVLIREYSPAA